LLVKMRILQTQKDIWRSTLQITARRNKFLSTLPPPVLATYSEEAAQSTYLVHYRWISMHAESSQSKRKQIMKRKRKRKWQWTKRYQNWLFQKRNRRRPFIWAVNCCTKVVRPTQSFINSKAHSCQRATKCHIAPSLTHSALHQMRYRH